MRPNGGEFHDYSKGIKLPAAQDALAKRGLDTTSALVREADQKLGGYVLLGDRMCIVSVKDTEMIYAAIKQAGGILPNWAARS